MNSTIQAPLACSLKINYSWRKKIKTLHFLILHESNTKKHWGWVFSRVCNVDPRVQGGIVMTDALCDGRGASVSQTPVRKIKLCFPCCNSCKQNFKYTFNKNIWTCNTFWLVWMDEKPLWFVGGFCGGFFGKFMTTKSVNIKEFGQRTPLKHSPTGLC